MLRDLLGSDGVTGMGMAARWELEAYRGNAGACSTHHDHAHDKSLVVMMVKVVDTSAVG